MHSTLSRLNAVSALATTIVLVLVVLIDITRFGTHKPTGKVVINQLEVVRAKAAWHMDRNIQDFVEVSFNIDADFEPLFDWNTKQVFVSLAASYESPKHVKNEVVIWDRILRSKHDAHVALNTVKNKYGFREVGRSFKDIQNTTFTLKYNIMPKVGMLHYADEFTSHSIPIPPKQLLPNGEQPKIQRLYY
ncbi:related to SPC3-signal peptidase subunit [Sporisorium reilianum f. sp. reilianum]|uniref:Signal peptidase subunit 3 n=1 Tax=Sporisorium reilianum f. sp. reilianum TaxID=72559 RepID=A0A2N8UC62_9BASI|nr:related to SPC3-signal peptidase subunit [Sporisorium reilianum f. sp. reilianum]